MGDALTILSERKRVPAGGKLSSDFWVAEGFASIKGIAKASVVGENSLVRIIQSIDRERVDRQRTVKMYDADCDIRLVEPVVSTLVKVEFENGASEAADLAIDIKLKKERIERGEVKYRDFFNQTISVAAGSTFIQNVVDLQEALGRSVTSLRVSMPSLTDVVKVRINDLATTEFPVTGERRWTPEEDQLEICRIFIQNDTLGAIDVTVFGS